MSISGRKRILPVTGAELPAKPIDRLIVDFIAESVTRTSFKSLSEAFCKNSGWEVRTLKRHVTGLVNMGMLCYANHYGQTYIEISFDRPRQLSRHIVIKPPSCSLAARAGQFVIDIEKGSSFGSGEHPTTRLCIRLIDGYLFGRQSLDKMRAIDIGTGSGILAIVAAKLGVGHVTAIDNDPCALFEACRNVQRNRMENQIHVGGDELLTESDRIGVAMANLRTPTLLEMASLLDRKLNTPSAMILSGMKNEEVSGVVDAYAGYGFSVQDCIAEKGWAALCAVRD